MPPSALATKLKLRPGARALVMEAPAGYLAALLPMPDGVAVVSEGPADWVQLFVRTQQDLARDIETAATALSPEGILWLTFPKGSSNIQTDLTRDRGWDAVAPLDLKWINLVSVDATWSAFGLRRYRPGEARQSFR